MSCIERTIQVSYRHRVYFTRGVLSPANGLLEQVLTAEKHNGIARGLAVVGEMLADSQSAILRNIESSFADREPHLHLVCAPIIIEGGERAKNSYFHVSEIQ